MVRGWYVRKAEGRIALREGDLREEETQPLGLAAHGVEEK